MRSGRLWRTQGRPAATWRGPGATPSSSCCCQTAPSLPRNRCAGTSCCRLRSLSTCRRTGCSQRCGGRARLAWPAASSPPLTPARAVPWHPAPARTCMHTQNEWRSLGVQQSRGWEHYAIHRPEPHIMLFRCGAPALAAATAAAGRLRSARSRQPAAAAWLAECPMPCCLLPPQACQGLRPAGGDGEPAGPAAGGRLSGGGGAAHTQRPRSSQRRCVSTAVAQQPLRGQQ